MGVFCIIIMGAFYIIRMGVFCIIIIVGYFASSLRRAFRMIMNGSSLYHHYGCLLYHHHGSIILLHHHYGSIILLHHHYGSIILLHHHYGSIILLHHHYGSIILLHHHYGSILHHRFWEGFFFFFFLVMARPTTAWSVTFPSQDNSRQLWSTFLVCFDTAVCFVRSASSQCGSGVVCHLPVCRRACCRRCVFECL